MTNGRCTILDWPRLTIIITQAGGIQTFWHQTSDSLMSSYIMYHSKSLGGFAHWVCYKLGQIWLAKPSLLWILSFSSCDRPVCCFISASCVCAKKSQIQYLHSLSYHSLLFIDHKRPLRDVGQEHKGTYYREINDVFVNVLHTRSTKEPTPRPSSSSSSYSINRKTSF